MKKMPRFAILLLGVVLVFGTRCPANAVTSAGTAITNLSSTTYNDGSNNYTTSSNTVTTYVQNVPSMTVTNPTVQNVTPTMVAVDTFTFTNTGNNASGTFALTGDATFGGTATGTTLDGYVLNGASSGTCSAATPCTYTTLNAQAGMTTSGSTVTVGVEYTVSASATTGQTIQPSIGANITYAAGTGTSSSTSSNVTNTTYSDTLSVDARLDIQASATTPGNAGANITWTVTANNGGGMAAEGLAAVKVLFGGTSNGIALFIPVPAYNGTTLTLQSQPGTPTLSGSVGGATLSALYYNATPCSAHPSTGWTTSYSSSAACLAIYVYNGSSPNILPSAPSGSGGAGSVSTPQISFSFVTNQPSGAGSANTNAVTMVVNSAIGGAGWATGAVPIMGQGLSVGSTTDAATASLLNTIQTNTTPSSGTTPPGGASNQAGSQAYPSYLLNNGPFGNPDVTGWYPGASGTPSADTAHDFTALTVPCTSNSTSSVNGLSCTVPTNIVLVNTVRNEGNVNDTIQLSATAPTGWKVQLYSATGCTAFTGTGCTQGSAITSQSADGGTASGTVSVASQTSLDYEAVYNATGNATTPFAIYDTAIAAAGQSGSGTGTDANGTHNDLLPGGVVKLTSAVSVTSTYCPAGESPSNSGACPGGTLSYTLSYANIVPSAVDANHGTEPSFAYGACYTNTGTLVITDDGTANPSGAPSANNWATYTNGVAAAASDTTANTVFTYYPSASTTFSANQTKWTARIGGASYQLPPGGSGTITFTAIAK